MKTRFDNLYIEELAEANCWNFINDNYVEDCDVRICDIDQTIID